jgi:hypothetical protein
LEPPLENPLIDVTFNMLSEGFSCQAAIELFFASSFSSKLVDVTKLRKYF